MKKVIGKILCFLSYVIRVMSVWLQHGDKVQAGRHSMVMIADKNSFRTLECKYCGYTESSPKAKGVMNVLNN